MQNKYFVAEFTMEMAFPKVLLDQIATSFGPEKAREAAMSTSVGGIGPLLRDRVYGQADLGLDVITISLLYERVWVQAWHEWGQLNLQKRTVGPELRKVLKPTNLGFAMEGFNGRKLTVDVWQADYERSATYFLSVADATEVVYPGPKDAPRGTPNPNVWSHEMRLMQSWILGRGGLTLIKKLGRKPDVINLSETPTIFSCHKIVRDELHDDEFFKNVKYVFNDHTPLEYAHPIWDQHTIDIVKLDTDLYKASRGWNAQKKTLDVTSLLVGTCDGVFGVARKHGDVMRAMSSLKEFAPKISYITNGVRKEEWQAPEFSNPPALTDQQLLETKDKLKKQMLDWAWRRCKLWNKWAEHAQTKRIVVLTRRITPYKRLDVLVKVLNDPEMRERFIQSNVVIFVGGRIHQQDNHAQDIVYDLLDSVEKKEILRERIIFLDNFNVWEAYRLYQGCDGTIMMADDTREASATGFMKAQMNGAAIIATSDGAIPEFVEFENVKQAMDTRIHEAAGNVVDLPNGFFIPYVNGEPTAKGLIESLEAFDRAMSDPKRRAEIVRASMAYTPILDIKRTAEEMIRFYDAIFQPVSA